MSKVGAAFAESLKRMLREKRKNGLTIDKAAKRLGVSRQQFHAYLNGKLPRPARLSRAMHIFELKLDLKEHSFGKEAFEAHEKARVSPEWRQLTLFEALDAISDQDLQVSVKRTGKVFRVHVSIEIPA
jgi:transcriptional regulator with XRE-family HTH domain